MNKYFYIICVALFLVACSRQSSSINIVEDYVDAYNQHDIEEMLEYLSEDVRWMSVTGDSVAVETTGKPELKTALEGYFKGLPSARSELQHIAVHGNFVNAIEKAIWENDKGEQAQCASSVYELEDNLIKNIWYYPSSPC